MLKVYGLKNCDTCRKARKWMAAEGISHDFQDIRDTPVARAVMAGWVSAIGVETLLNKRGTTWRGLSDEDKGRTDEAGLVDLMQAHPALIKRPVFEIGDEVLVGFSPAVSERLAKSA